MTARDPRVRVVLKGGSGPSGNCGVEPGAADAADGHFAPLKQGP